MAYEVTSHDVCVQGFERLRNNSEILLVVTWTNQDKRDILDSLHDELNSCERPDGFSYREAKEVVKEFVDSTIFPHIDMEFDDEGDVIGEYCNLYVYLDIGSED